MIRSASSHYEADGELGVVANGDDSTSTIGVTSSCLTVRVAASGRIRPFGCVPVDRVQASDGLLYRGPGTTALDRDCTGTEVR
ncbi:hypothetical protein C446_16010 [Halobiforma nitratireducens JCM 10879]|uniref:Uncharacterized protein n=1 Tax=Halobiforma nitratireducens JCM 10879 TaxID=1227454 RepID=M0LGF1_9EURY|nr:hypothetical protein C446_16010 [Halobiforma nitratireducens JCM 10879]